MTNYLLKIIRKSFLTNIFLNLYTKSRKENPQKLTQLSSRSHPRHLVGKRTAQKDTIIDITSDNQPSRHKLLVLKGLAEEVFSIRHYIEILSQNAADF